MSTKKDDTVTTKATSPDASLYRPGQSVQEEQAFQVSRSIDQTKENIKRSIEEARRAILWVSPQPLALILERQYKIFEKSF